MKEATQKGASYSGERPEEGATGSVGTPELNPRNKQLDELAKARAEQVQTESAELESLYGESQPETPEPEQTTEPPKRTRKLKVDGQEVEVEEDKVFEAGVRALQKESAADKRLEEATRLLREAQARAEQPAQQQQPSEDPDVALAVALQYGDQQAAVNAIKQLKEAGGVKPEQQQQVLTQVLAMLDYRDGVSYYQQEYSDLAGDPYCNQLVGEGLRRARALGDKRPTKELLKQFGEELRQWRGVTMDDKKARKSEIQEVQSAGGKKPAPQPEKPKSTEETIADMASRRRALRSGK